MPSIGIGPRRTGHPPSCAAAALKTHIARILARLGLRDRVQVVVAAYESGFVDKGR